MKRAIFLLAFALSLSGCAVVSDYWRKPTKYKQIPQDIEKSPSVGTLSLDASRRLVISQQKDEHLKDPRFTCPEPPPDVAMNTISQTLLALSKKSETTMEAGSAYQAIAQALHARTSTVEIWRTTSSTYCVLLMNGEREAATAYLKQSSAALSASKDTTITTPAAAAFIDGLMAKANEVAAEQEAEKKASEEKTAAEKKAAEEKAAAEKEAVALEAAKKECEKAPEDKKAEDANCKLVKAAEEKAKAGASSG